MLAFAGILVCTKVFDSWEFTHMNFTSYPTVINQKCHLPTDFDMKPVSFYSKFHSSPRANYLICGTVMLISRLKMFHAHEKLQYN